MPNTYFQFKQFTIHHDRCAMKVTTDACLFGAWVALEIEKEKSSKKSCLDIGTGTGLLSLMVVQKNTVLADAIEVDESAAGQAKENIDASPWKDKVAVINEDALHWKTKKQYDYILSNPPFYENDLKSMKQSKNIAHHDEGLTLSSLLGFIRKNLKDDGQFFLLYPAKRETELNSLLHQFNLFLNKKVYVKQTPDHQPFRLMIRGSMSKPTEIFHQELIIKNNDQHYTPAFVFLLKDYYLYL